MRSYIMATEQLALEEDETVIEEPAVLRSYTALEEDLERIMFKLRAFMESSGGDYALGIEAGMQRAADMIENALRRYRETDSGY